jgi:site-specific DNA recombinase
MNRTIIYARVSTEDQLEKYGLPVQLRACRDYAAQHSLSVIEEITDDGISGAILERPGLARIRQRIAAGETDVLLMLDVDRLSRELAHLLILKPEIEKKARLEFVTAKFEDSPSGRLFFGIRGVIAQYERELTLQRTMRGRLERAKAGLVTGWRTAYGYRYEAGKLIPQEDRAAVVRDIFNWYEAGISQRAIALRLRERGAPTWSGRKWGKSSVRRILVNETYSGVAYYTVRPRDSERKVIRNQQPMERVAIFVPTIISREQWERVQALLARNPWCGRPTKTFLLNGILHCPCGRRMSGQCYKHKRGYTAYRCYGRDPLKHSGPHCRKNLNARRVEAAVWGTVEKALTDADYLRSLLAPRADKLQAVEPERVENLRSQVKKLERKEAACLQALLDPDLAGSRAAIKGEYRAAQNDRVRIEREVAALEQAALGAQSAVEWLDATVTLLREYIPTLEGVQARRQFLREVVQRADWDGASGVTLDCFLGAELGTMSF